MAPATTRALILLALFVAAVVPRCGGIARRDNFLRGQSTTRGLVMVFPPLPPPPATRAHTLSKFRGEAAPSPRFGKRPDGPGRGNPKSPVVKLKRPKSQNLSFLGDHFFHPLPLFPLSSFFAGLCLNRRPCGCWEMGRRRRCRSPCFRPVFSPLEETAPLLGETAPFKNMAIQKYGGGVPCGHG